MPCEQQTLSGAPQVAGLRHDHVCYGHCWPRRKGVLRHLHLPRQGPWSKHLIPCYQSVCHYTRDALGTVLRRRYPTTTADLGYAIPPYSNTDPQPGTPCSQRSRIVETPVSSIFIRVKSRSERGSCANCDQGSLDYLIQSCIGFDCCQRISTCIDTSSSPR